jgi:ankyrin repeat protein
MSNNELIEMSMKGDIDGLRQLLAYNYVLNTLDNGDSPLSLTARNEHPSSFLDVRDERGTTALILAISGKHYEVASALIDAGADASLASSNGTTSLMVCHDVALAKRLLDLGVDLHAKNEGGMNALLLACQSGCAEVVSLLLERGADRCSQDSSGKTGLVHACQRGCAAVLEVLLERGPQPGDCDRSAWVAWLGAGGVPALHCAVRAGSARCVQALISAGADVHATDRDGVSALQLVRDVDMARILLDAGAGEADEGVSATALVCQDPARTEVLRLLLQRFPDSGPEEGSYLVDAADAGNLEVVRVLLDERPVGYVNKQDSRGCTALSGCSHPAVVRLLLERGADPRIVDNKGKTPLMNVMKSACVRPLLEAAPDLVGMRDLEGRTATAHLAHLSPRDSMFSPLEELFLFCEEHGIDADINNKDVNGETALQKAIIWGNSVSMMLLLEKGAEVLGSDGKGMTTLMMLFMTASPHGGFRRTTAMPDAATNACLRVMLDTVLRCGGGKNSAIRV